MNLSELKPEEHSRKNRKRVGRGPGSGHGKTCCRGTKGQNCRSGGGVRVGFEGGQMPLQRRLPKRGFYNPFKKIFDIVNLERLKDVPAQTIIDPVFLYQHGMISKLDAQIKILGNGELEQALVIKAHKVSKTAREKIEKVGGQVEVL